MELRFIGDTVGYGGKGVRYVARLFWRRRWRYCNREGVTVAILVQSENRASITGTR